MKKLILSFFISLLSFLSYGQSLNVNGVVTETSTGEPLPGVGVVIKNTTRGTETDFDGKFNLVANQGDILVFSFIGYKTKEVQITSTTINVSLDEDSETLDEVVVVGYGTQKKKEVTGAVAVVDAEAIEKLNPTRVEQALQGQVTGVNITSASGSPGSGLNISIRGVSTNGDSRPLILVDGNPIVDLSVINPNDIKSVNVLKDATAAIYGVRAANGVILITTKSGRKETPLTLTLDAYTGLQTTSKKLDLLGPREFAKYVNDAAGSGNTQYFVYPNSGTDWQDEVFEQAILFDLNFGASGGTEKSTYSFGLGYLDQDGIVGGEKNNYNRITARFNYQYDLLKNLKLTATGIYTHSQKENLPEGGIGAVLYNAVNVNPDLSVRDANGDFSLIDRITQIEIRNPLAQIANTFNTTRVDKYSGTLGLDYTFLENFTVSSRFQGNHAIVLDDAFIPAANYGTITIDPEDNQLNDFDSVFEDYTWDNYITYKNTFGENHDLTVLLGASIYRERGEFNGEVGFGQLNGINTIEEATIENAAMIDPRIPIELQEVGEGVFDERLYSIFSRLQYSYKGKYLFSGVLRRDVSSKFNPDENRNVGYFPSVSLGWNVTEENFMEDVNWLNSLKLRASYGEIGNDRVRGGLPFLSLLNGQGNFANGNDIVPGIAPGIIPNEDFTWETQKTLNIGFDARLFNNVSLTFDVYNRETEDLLVQVPVSGTLGSFAPGSGVPVINAGTVENRGVEVGLNYNGKLSEDFKFSIGANMSYNKNEVTKVGFNNDVIEGGEFGVGISQVGISRMEEGLPMGYFYGYKTDGIIQTQTELDQLNAASPSGTYHTGAQPGDLKFVDVDGNGFIDEDDRTNLGDPLPDFTFGFNVGFNYKNFDFSANAFASLGNDLIRDYERKDLFANRGDYMLNRWQGSGTSNSVPRASSGASINTDLFSDFYVEDASYLRLQNVQLGYSFNGEKLEKAGFSKLRIYVSGNNLFTVTDYKGYDPSANNGAPIGGGIDKGFYPVASSYLLGVNVKFK